MQMNASLQSLNGHVLSIYFIQLNFLLFKSFRKDQSCSACFAQANVTVLQLWVQYFKVCVKFCTHSLSLMTLMFVFI